MSTSYNVTNVNGITQITGNIGSWTSAPSTITCSSYNVTQINVFSIGGNSTLSFGFLTGTLVLPDGASYNINLPVPISGVTITLSAIDANTTLFYCIVGAV